MQAGARELSQHVMMSAVARHIASDRQLLEVMTDFWTNHFNVYMPKNADRFLTADFVEKAIRPNALGRFEDLLVATAEHPAMLIYLDNARERGAGIESDRGPARSPSRPTRAASGRCSRLRSMMPPPRPRAPNGINENYARELMELHTLGVDGGYTQQDVIEVARIFTGWGVSRPRPMGPGRFAFEYHAWAHDDGDKEVLGVRFTGGGMKEGLRLLHLLAEHPATARHVSHELCARFVADDPPGRMRGRRGGGVAAHRRRHPRGARGHRRQPGLLGPGEPARPLQDAARVRGQRRARARRRAGHDDPPASPPSSSSARRRSCASRRTATRRRRPTG